MSPSSADPFSIVGVKWVEGGRDPATGLDCLGATIVVAEMRGLPTFDPWKMIQEMWERGDQSVREGLCLFPPGWVQLQWPGTQPMDDDVVILTSACATKVPTGIGIMCRGHLITAEAQCGVIALPFDRVFGRVQQLWRVVADDKTDQTCRAKFPDAKPFQKLFPLRPLNFRGIIS